MTTPSRTCHFSGCNLEVLEGFDGNDLCLEHYLAEATERLHLAARGLQTGQGFDHETLNWLLVQVDFAAEVMSDEIIALSADQRSKLLELMLGIANFNEHVRQYAANAQLAR